MTKEQALFNFWNGFDLKAYDEQTVPNNATLPYITYETSVDYFDREVTLTASVWYQGNSWKDVTEKGIEISDYIGYGGKIIEYEGGALWIKRGSPFMQRMADDSSKDIRRIVLNITAEYLSAN